MPETLTDEQILGITDDTGPGVSSESSGTSESLSPIESQQEQTGEETQFEQPEVQAKPQTDKPQQQPGKPQDKTQQPAKEGTPEQAQEVIAAKAAELDRADAAFASGDIQGMAETFEQVFGENPSACADALWMGLRFLEQRSPEHLSNFSRMVVADQLGEQGVWNALELIYESAQKSGAQETLALLDQLAGGLQQIYGLGPQTPEAQAAEMSNYTANVGAMMDKDVPAMIARAFGARFNAVQPKMQEELFTAVRLELRDRLLQDKTVTGALQKLSKGYSAKEGARIYYDVVLPRVRSLVGMIAPNLANQYADIFKSEKLQTRPQPAQKPAQPIPTKPKSMAEYGAEGKTLGDITREVLGELDETNPIHAGSDEANRMSDLDILNSNRAGQRRASWRPGSELDA